MSSKMPLWAQIKSIWKEKCVGCFAQSEELVDRIPLPPSAANHVTYREIFCSSFGTHSNKLSPRIYLFLLTSTLVIVVNSHPSHLSQDSPSSALAELHSGLTVEETNPAAQSQDQQYGQPQSVALDAGSQTGTQAIGEPTASASKQTSDADQIEDAWVVQGVGTFSNKAVYTFNGDTLPEGLFKSDYPVQDSERDMDEGVPQIPYNHRFEPENVQIRNGSLYLRVPGRQKPRKRQNKEISSAQIETTETHILHASVRTRARFSIFFYSNDQHETDIEYLTDPRSLSNNGPDDPIPIWYSNQKRDPVGSSPSAETGPAPFDATSRVHEYRIHWTAEFTAFYIDGVLQKYLTENVPSLPGPWLWNNWANGDKGWSVGPPAEDNELEIQSIVMYYNTWAPDEE
ncbi:uncharacterized protein A1O9_08961 [Exophiala aquamarina CBS 119918]|uniref:GH16 domain-containing protein n=1 Tax=Exophiala aquamarina CBS 119918 TaxID=1182545 RepID=A0A072P6I5_9EURO|nr:uncharacterized protein A1O9_08961 [Exophiala aquamarina CBS 119918]KEF55307.1 hypothetical protein A1O9_08961 [Exophiala aquamarina CBS 119918]